MRDILFVTDFVCPYCIVAEEALRQALNELHMEAQIRFWPMELTEEPNERVDTYHDPVRREHYKVLDEPVRQLGLDVKFPPKVIPRPYTRLAWEGWHYAKEKGMGDIYANRMYHAYFTEQLDIGDMEVLVKLAEELGLDAKEYRRVLEDGIYQKMEKEATSYSRNELQIKSIPTIFFDGEQVKLKEYTKEELMRLLTEEPSADGVLMMNVDENMSDEDEYSFACGPDGCGPRTDGADIHGAGGCGPDGCAF
ncbi:MAG: DsbA family protein [Brotaphodocola sp.]